MLSRVLTEEKACKIKHLHGFRICSPNSLSITRRDSRFDVKKRLKDADIKGFAGFFKAIKTSTWKEIKEGKTIVECAR